MAYPNYQDLNPDTAFTDVVTFVGGTWLNILTTITLIVSFGIATTQASQVAVARVLFAMGEMEYCQNNLHMSVKKHKVQ